MATFTENRMPIPIILDQTREFKAQAKVELRKMRSKNLNDQHSESSLAKKKQVHQVKESLRGWVDGFMDQQHEEWLKKEEVVFKNAAKAEMYQNTTRTHYSPSWTTSPARSWNAASPRRSPPGNNSIRMVNLGSL